MVFMILMTKTRSLLTALAISLLSAADLPAAEPQAQPKPKPKPDLEFLGPRGSRTFDARDTLAPASEPSADARECLKGLTWKPDPFRVRCETADDGRGEVLLRFPSPVDTGNATNDQVAVEWYVAGLDTGKAKRARAVVVVHESGRGMTVGRLFAATLRKQGLHAFMVQLPGYGHRAGPGDAVTALPLVDSSHVSLQGTSLGGFVVASSASLDAGYDSVFVMLAGGNLYEMIQKGKRDTARVREKLAEAGVSDEQLRKLTGSIEPTRVAHRLDPKRTWLFTGIRDTVVPMESALALAKAARLPTNHHVLMPTNHYTGIVLLPSMCRLIAKQVKTLPARKR